MSGASSRTGSLHTAMRKAAVDFLETDASIKRPPSGDEHAKLITARDLVVARTLAYVAAWEAVYVGQEPLKR